MDLSDDEKIKFLYERIREETDAEKVAMLGEELRSLLAKERAEKRSKSTEEPT
jgi:hypothetical protein